MIRREHRIGLSVGTLLWLVAASVPCAAQWCDEEPPASTQAEAEQLNATAARVSEPVAPQAPTPRLGDDDTRLSDFEATALSRGTPDIPGLNIVWLTPWINPALARDWRNIVVHQSEGPAGSAWRNALSQTMKPDRRGVTIWVETDGTVVWAVAEFAVPGHTVSNRNDNRYIDNRTTFRQVNNDNSIGVEFVGNYPNVRRRPTEAQFRAWRILLRVLQVRYAIADDHVFAHNWVSHKDRRYCEGCELAAIARTPDKPIVLVAKNP
jgi:hypothetical protein